MPTQYILDSTGAAVAIDNYVKSYTYDANGNVTSIVATDPVSSAQWTKTYTITAGKLTAESAWTRTR